MGWPSREEVIRQMGLDDTQWKEASFLQDMLSTLQHQRESNPDPKSVKGERTGYTFASHSMYRHTFHTVTEPYYDRRRKCLWYLGWRVRHPIIWYPFLTKAGTKRARIPRTRNSKDLLHHARKPLPLRLQRAETTFETNREIRHVESGTQAGIC